MTITGYDDLGRPSVTYRTNGPTTSYGYGPNLRLTSLALGFVDTTKDVAFGYDYNPAGQLDIDSSSNALYDWTVGYDVVRSYTTDGQNKYTAAGPASLSYDGRGNLANDGATAYGYDVENRLTSAGSAAQAFDPLDRLFQTTGSATTRFLYDGDQIIAEYDGSGALQRRYVPLGTDEPALWLEGTTTSAMDRRWLLADPHGSIVAIGTSGASNTTLAINTYDEAGIAGPSNLGRFQWKGMAWIPEVGLYHDRARAYSPTLGRFMQSDPIGYDDGMNFYNFAHGDPVNGSDPSGQAANHDAMEGEAIGASEARAMAMREARAAGRSESEAVAAGEAAAARAMRDDPFGNGAAVEQLVDQGEAFVKSVENFFTGKGWTSKDAEGPGGKQFQDPKDKGNNVRAMPGDPKGPNPSQQGPYAKVQQGGKLVDKNGNKIDPNANGGKPGDTPQAHVPADQAHCVLDRCF